MKISNEVGVGALTIVAIVVFILGYRFLNGENLFARMQTVNVGYTDVTGLYEANAVLLNGIKIGKVGSIKISENDSLPVVLEIELERNIKVPEDSKFEIVSLDLFGLKGIDFTPGKSKKLADPDKILTGTIKADMISSITATLAPITDKAAILMSSMDSLVNNLNSALGTGDKNYLGMSLKSLSSALASVNTLTGNLNQVVAEQKGNIGDVMVNAKKLTGNLNTLTEKLNANTGKLDNILSNFDTLSGNLNQVDLQGTVGEVKKTLTEINGFLDEINNGDGTISKLIKSDEVYNDIDKAIKSMDALLMDVKANPKRYVSLSLIERKDKTPKAPETPK